MLNGVPDSRDLISVPKYLLDLMGAAIAEYGDPVKCVVQTINFYMGQVQCMILRVVESGEVVSLTAIDSGMVLKALAEAYELGVEQGVKNE